MLNIEIDKGTGGHDFRIKHRNGHIICFTVQGYNRKATCKRVLRNMLSDIKHGRYVIKDLGK